MEKIKFKNETKNLFEENRENLKLLFPEVFNEESIDFNKLKILLNENDDYLDSEIEKYEFTWPGKTKAFNKTFEPINCTLRPYKNENWNSTENIYIEGENLKVLKLLQNSYQNRIKMIYIDPPYNTGNEFLFDDNYKESSKDYEKSSGSEYTTNKRSEGRFHTKWLNMMYPRLRLAKNLLTSDGVMFISIDDYEIDNLIKICNEIFHESNVDVMIWRKSGIGRDGKMKNTPTFRKDHEYIVVCYNRELKLNKSFEKPNWEKSYGNRDNDPRGNYEAGSISRTENASNPDHENYYSVKSPSGNIITRQFEVSKEEFERLDKDNRIWWGKQGNSVPRVKIFEDEEREVTTSSLLSISDELNSDVIDDKECTTTKGSKELDEILNISKIGNEMRPKPVELIKKLLRVGSGDNDIILDFFSGTSTTFQAIMEFNEKYGTSKKAIMVQIPEEIVAKDNKVAHKEGYTNICQIAQDRIKNSANLINKDIDTGFKLFKLDTSNFKEVNFDSDNLQTTLTDLEYNIKDDRSDDDLIYDILLEQGHDLNLNVKPDGNLYIAGDGALIICLKNNITLDIIEEIVKIKNELNPVTCKVVIKESGFTSDCVKINCKEILDTNGVDKLITI